MSEDVLAELKAELHKVRASNIDTLSVDVLLNYIASLETQRPLLEAENKRRWEKYLEDHRSYLTSQRDWAIAMFDSVITSGQAAVRILLTINGGAALAILAFLGRLASVRPDLVSQFSAPLTSYTVGVFCAAAVAAFSYLTQLSYSEHSTQPVGRGLHFLTVVLAFVSAASFVDGLLTTRELFENFGPAP